MKRGVVTIIVLTSTALTVSISLSQEPPNRISGAARPVNVRAVASTSWVNPTVAQIVVVTDDGVRMTFQMDYVTARSLAAQIRNMELEPTGAP